VRENSTDSSAGAAGRFGDAHAETRRSGRAERRTSLMEMILTGVLSGRSGNGSVSPPDIADAEEL